jgi:pilus assembly protein CpaD
MTRRQKLRSGPARSGAVPIAAALGLALSACAPDRAVTGSIYPYDYHNRHPIVLADAPRQLDVFIGSGQLDPRQRAEVAAFALEYRRYGRGGVVAQVPSGTPASGAAYATLDGVRAALAEGGLAPASVAVTSYAVLDPRVASTIRLSFQRLQARVESRCGLWPKDLGVSDLGADIRNEPYWNLGCATQANFAAQIDDPIDLVRGRREGRIDTVRRSNDISKVRNGQDPSITWKQDGQTSVKSQAGQ